MTSDGNGWPKCAASCRLRAAGNDERTASARTDQCAPAARFPYPHGPGVAARVGDCSRPSVTAWRATASGGSQHLARWTLCTWRKQQQRTHHTRPHQRRSSLHHPRRRRRQRIDVIGVWPTASLAPCKDATWRRRDRVPRSRRDLLPLGRKPMPSCAVSRPGKLAAAASSGIAPLPRRAAGIECAVGAHSCRSRGRSSGRPSWSRRSEFRGAYRFPASSLRAAYLCRRRSARSRVDPRRCRGAGRSGLTRSGGREERTALANEQRLSVELAPLVARPAQPTNASWSAPHPSAPAAPALAAIPAVRAAAVERPLPATVLPDRLPAGQVKQLKEEIYRELLDRIRTDFERGS